MTASVMVRKDLGTPDRAAQGPEDRNQTGSLSGNYLRRPDRPKHGSRRGTTRKCRMDVNNMITALSAKTVDVMVNVGALQRDREATGWR